MVVPPKILEYEENAIKSIYKRFLIDQKIDEINFETKMNKYD